MRHILVFLAALAAASVSHAGVHVGVGGTWYDPARPGHGFGIEILDRDIAVALWHTYDPGGNPLTLYLSGRIEGNSIMADAFAPSGMRFGEFDPASVVEEPWGTVRIDFVDCAHATVHYQPATTGYASGSLPIERLLTPAAPQCSLDALATLPKGGYHIQSGPLALVQPDGSFFAVPNRGAFSANWMEQGTGLLRGQQTRAATGKMRVELEQLVNDWMCHRHPVACDFLQFPLQPLGAIEFDTSASSAAGLLWNEVGEPIPLIFAGPRYVYTGTEALPAMFPRSLPFKFFDGYVDFQATFAEYLLVLEDRQLCVRSVEAATCIYSGSVSDDGAFTLQRAGESVGPVYDGYAYRWWEPFAPSAGNIVLLGSAGAASGLALCAGERCP